ncbi:MAG: metal-sensitive transcriptional regulator [bacterium]|nr:metal-sensitive transcriptional regulator [bacterium]
MTLGKTAKSERDKMLSRIARIEGQLRGVRRMVEGGEECLDVITQISAIREAVAMLGVELLKDDIFCKWDGRKKIDEAYLKNLFKMQ